MQSNLLTSLNKVWSPRRCLPLKTYGVRECFRWKRISYWRAAHLLENLFMKRASGKRKQNNIHARLHLKGNYLGFPFSRYQPQARKRMWDIIKGKCCERCFRGGTKRAFRSWIIAWSPILGIARLFAFLQHQILRDSLAGTWSKLLNSSTLSLQQKKCLS